MSTPVAPKLVSKANAELVAQIDPKVIEVILRLSSFGLKPNDIVGYCEKVVDGDDAGAPPKVGVVKPLKIQAYSFLSDTSICVNKYGMDVGEAANALLLMRTDKDAAMRIVNNVVSDYLRARNSPKSVVVTDDGLPSSKGGATVSGDGGGAELSELMRRNQMSAGAYKFTAKPHGPVGPENFIVLLGGNLAVVGQNTAVAVKAAKLVRVLGRKHPTLIKYVRLYAPGRSLATADKITEKVYDGILAPDEKLPPDEVPNGSKVG